MAKKAAYHHGDLRQALIAGAIALIADTNIERLSLREVARRVGVSHAAPYRHFADKEALLAAVAEEGFRDLSQTLLTNIQRQPADPVQQLQEAGKSYIHWGLSHPSYYRVMFGAYRNHSVPDSTLHQAAAHAFQVLVDIVIRGQATGIMKADNPRLMADIAWALVHGLVMLMLDGQLPQTQVEELTHAGTRSLTQGLVNTSRSQ